MNFTEISQIFSQYVDGKFTFIGYQFSVITLIAIFIFIGCMGKSAQFGLHIWLPDAMEGPTPVSALIHAATMVTAGIFLVARCYYFFDASVDAQSLILIISSITMIFAAITFGAGLFIMLIVSLICCRKSPQRRKDEEFDGMTTTTGMNTTSQRTFTNSSMR